jgi:hypothetical protein
MVRKMVDRCVEHILPDPMTRDRVAPLGWMMSIEKIRDVVSSRIATQIDGLITGEDPAAAITGMHLALNLETTLSSIERSNIDSERSQECHSYWSQQSLKLSESYRVQILSHIYDDASLLIATYYKDWVTIASMEGWPLQPWNFLFTTDVKVGIGESIWLAPASALARSYASGEPFDSPRWNALEEVLDIIKELGAPPWNFQNEGAINFWPINMRDIRPLPPEAGITARTSAMILLGIIFDANSLDIRKKDFGHLGKIIPYMQSRETAKRGKEFVGQLVPLDIDAQFQSLFDAWAVGAVDFAILNPRQPRNA